MTIAGDERPRGLTTTMMVRPSIGHGGHADPAQEGCETKTQGAIHHSRFHNQSVADGHDHPTNLHHDYSIGFLVSDDALMWLERG